MRKGVGKIKEKNIIKDNSGVALLAAIILISVVAGILLILVTLAILGLNISKQRVRQLSALDVSEAGINYYLWHLVHAPGDYCDGNTCSGSPPYGPYVHNFTDNTGAVIGTYTLWIAPPGITQGGKVVMCHKVPPNNPHTITVAPSSVVAHLAQGDSIGSCEGGGGAGSNSNEVVVESKGKVVGGNENRTIMATLGIPSFSRYAVVANDTKNDIRFGVGTEVWGPIHNNGGVRFDGVAHALVTSALATYRDPDTGLTEPGVYTTQPNPSQVFLGGTNFPVPTVDFTKISTDFSNLRNTAKSGGWYYPSSGSGYLGYHIILKTDDTFNIYKVSDTSDTCWSGGAWQDTDRIDSETVGTNVPFPANGVIFVEDKLWIEGQIQGASLTIAAAQIGANQSQYKSIIINHDLKYTSKDGSDKLGLIAQNNISVGLYSDGAFSGTDDQKELRVDAAMIAQNGRVGRNYFDQSCDSTYYQRNTITVYGSITTNQRYGFAWICGDTWTKGDPCDSGYQTRNLTYDQNTALAPPPFFPTTGSYTILDWREE